MIDCFSTMIVYLYLLETGANASFKVCCKRVFLLLSEFRKEDKSSSPRDLFLAFLLTSSKHFLSD